MLSKIFHFNIPKSCCHLLGVLFRLTGKLDGKITPGNGIRLPIIGIGIANRKNQEQQNDTIIPIHKASQLLLLRAKSFSDAGKISNNPFTS